MNSLVHFAAIASAFIPMHFLLCRLSNEYRNHWLRFKYRAARRYQLWLMDRHLRKVFP